jgi:hypothetical protein
VSHISQSTAAIFKAACVRSCVCVRNEGGGGSER